MPTRVRRIGESALDWAATVRRCIAMNRRRFLVRAGQAGALAAAPQWLRGAPPAGTRPPNFVIIFTDDQGYADVGVFGARDFETPNLDRMAREGRIFTNFHVAQPVCSASRAGLLTGCYPSRVG